MKRLSSIPGASAVALALSCSPTPGPRAFFSVDDRAVMAVVVPPSADAGARDTLLVRNQTRGVDISLMGVLDTVSILAPGLLRDFQVQNPVSLALGPGSLGARRIRTTPGDSVVHL